MISFTKKLKNIILIIFAILSLGLFADVAKAGTDSVVVVVNYEVSVSATAGGTVSPSSAVVGAGSSTTFGLTPDPGHYVSSASGCGGYVSGSTYYTGAINSNCTVSVAFTLSSFNVFTSVISGSGTGTISPTSASVAYGYATSFTLSPSAGHYISSASGCGGYLSGSTYYTGAIYSSCTVSVGFTINTVNIYTSVSSGSGYFDPGSRTINYGSATSFILYPGAGHYISSASGCGGYLSGSTFYTGNVYSDCTVSAVFSPHSYTVQVAYGGSGTVSPVYRIVSYGENTTFTVTPGEGHYVLEAVGCGGYLSGSIYYTGAITGDCYVSVSFYPYEYTVTGGANTGGTISPSSRNVFYGNTTTFTVGATAGYAVGTISAPSCPGSLSGTTYTTGAVVQNCTVTHTPTFIMSGSLTPSASSCLIPIGSNSCSVNLTWSTSNPIATSSITASGMTDVNGNSGSQAFTVPYNTRTFYLYNNGFLLASTTVSSSCSTGSTWNGSICLINSYTVSTSVGTGGSISPTSASVNYGSTTAFTITPSTGYTIATASGCGGTRSGSTYTTGAITAACTVSVTFSLNTYTVSSTAGAGGTISGAQTITHGSTASFTVTPNTGYSISSVTGCSGTLSGNTYTTAAITGACTVSATFVINSYTVSTSVGTGGSISPTSASVNYGSTTAFTITPSTGYSIASATGCGGTRSVNTYTTGAITAACTVSVTFSLNSYTVSTSVGSGGSVSPSSSTVSHGSATSFSIIPNAGYTISASGCSGSLSGNTYITGGITGPCVVSVSFSLQSYALNYSAGTGGTISGTTTQNVNYGSNATTVTAVPNTGYHFTGWSDDCTSSSTGGTIATATNGDRIHTFTSSGTFTPGTNCSPEVLVVAGGGGGSGNQYDDGAGGGGGGLIYNPSRSVSGATTVTVGAGGVAGVGGYGGSGNNSIFSGLTAVGGGGGGSHRGSGLSGGSGGGSGGAYGSTDVNNGGAGTAGQGNNGGSSVYRSYAGSGGGGAGSVGGTSSELVGGRGGTGLPFSISGANTYYAGGGGGYGINVKGSGGIGGGGDGTIRSGVAPTAGTPNTGGGGGGGQTPGTGTAAGGSGIVIVRYPVKTATRTDTTVTSTKSPVASFAINSYTVSATAGAGGSISPTSASVNYGSTTAFTITPSTGYSIASATGCGGTRSVNTYTTGAITAACTVSVTFSLNTYTVSTSNTGCATVSPTSATVNHGSTTAFTITPGTGRSITSTSGCAGSLSGGTYTTGAITGACTVSMSCPLNTYTVSSTAGAGGTISGAQTITHGSTASFTVTPNTGYSISSVTGCSGTLSGNTYTTAAITGACTVSASFVDNIAPSAPGIVTTSWARDHWVNGSFVASTTGSTDSGSGIRGYRLCRSHDGAGGCSVWTTAGEHASTSETVSGVDLPSPGTFKYYYWYAYDNAGNQSPASPDQYIRLDGIAPTYNGTNFAGCNYESGDNCYVKNGTTFYVNISHSDSQSGTHYQYFELSKNGTNRGTWDGATGNIKSYAAPHDVAYGGYYNSYAEGEGMTGVGYLDIQNAQCIQPGNCNSTAQGKWQVVAGSGASTMYGVTVFMYDQLWNGVGYTATSKYVYLDNTAPTVPTPTDAGVYSSGTSLTFSASPSDAYSGISTCYGQIDVNNTDGASLAMGTTDVGADGSHTWTGVAGNTYYYRYYCTDRVGNSSGWSSWSDGISINTAPSVVTPTHSSITSTSAVLGATVSSAGVPASITARGTCFGTTASPTTNCTAEGGVTTGAFSHTRSGLSPGTTYYYRGYATNSSGTSYSSDGSFTTTAPTGTLTSSAGSCVIPIDGSSCSVTLTWSTTNPVGTSAVTASGMTDVSGNSGSQAFTVPYNTRTFYLYNSGYLLASSAVSSSCEAGSTWNGSICARNSYTVSTSAGAGGSISPTSASVIHGSTTAFTITPSTGYSIASATGCGGTRSGSTYTTGAITAACTVSVTFSLNSYTVSASAGSGGSVSPSSITLSHGEIAVFNITPNAGYSISASGCGGSIVVNTHTYRTSGITGPCVVSVSFSLRSYTLNYSAGTNGSISGTTTQNVNYGTNATAVTAVPNTGYHFTGWSEGGLHKFTVGTSTFTVPAGVSSVESLVVAGGGGGGGSTAGGGGGGGVIYNSNYSVTPGSNITVTVGKGGFGSRRSDQGPANNTNGDNSVFGNLTAVGGGYGFSGYVSGSRVANSGGSGGGAGFYGGNDILISSPGSGTSGQGYRGGTVTSTDNWGGAGGGGAGGVGSPNSNPSSTRAGGVGVQYSISGTSSYYGGGGGGGVHASESPSPGGLGGGGDGGSGSPTIAEPGDVDTGGGGGGGGYYQIGPGGGAGGSGVVIVKYPITTASRQDTSVTTNKSVTASFAINSYTVSATAGAGGTISPTSTSVNHGSTTSFTMTPNTGYSVSSATGCGGTRSGNTYTTGAIVGDCTVSATFVIDTFALTVSKAGTGTGTVTSSPAGINCGSTCSYTFDTGTSVTLTATPGSEGNIFTGWSGACTGTSTCVLSMTTAKNVTATFSPIGVTVTPDATTYYSARSANQVFTFTSSTTTGTTECRLLNSSSTALTSYATGTSITYGMPANAGAYGYYIQCRNVAYPTKIATSSLITVYAVTVGVTATTSYSTTPAGTVSFAYTPTTTAGSTECALLNNAQTAITSYQAASPINYSIPNSEGSFGYYVRCRHTVVTSELATSALITVTSACSSGTSWNGTSCVTPTGTLTASVCSISAGNNTCQTSLSWNTLNPIGASEVTTNYPTTGSVAGSTHSGTNVPYTIPYGSTDFYLYNNSVLLSTASANASCASGTVWNTQDNQCQATTGTINATGCTINDGASSCPSTISWNTLNPVETSVVKTLSGTQIASGNNGSISHSVNPGSNTFNLWHYGNIIATSTATVVCSSLTEWNGTICELKAPEIATFTASQSNVVRGRPITLIWESEPDVTCSGTNFDTGGAYSGSVSVNPTVDTTYTLTCTRGTKSTVKSIVIKMLDISINEQ